MSAQRKRIPASEQVPYENWEMPDLTGVKRRIAQRLQELEQETPVAKQEPETPKPPTPEEIDAIRAAAEAEGYNQGLKQGQEEGYAQGLAQGQEEGQKTGQEQGFQEGYAKGLASAEAEINQQLARLKSILEQLQGPVAKLDADTEAALLSLVDLISRSILRREITLDRSYLGTIVTEAVAALPLGHQRLRISVNPEDLNLVEAACADLLEDYRLLPDAAITLGGAKVETLQSLVDSTLESRYQKIIEQLFQQAYQQNSPAVTSSLAPETLALEPSQPLASNTPLAPEAQAAAEPELSADLDNLDDLASLDDLDDLAELSSAANQPEPQQFGLTRGKAPKHLEPKHQDFTEPLADISPIETATSLESLDDLTDLDSALPESRLAEASNLEDLANLEDFLTSEDSLTSQDSSFENLPLQPKFYVQEAAEQKIAEQEILKEEKEQIKKEIKEEIVEEVEPELAANLSTTENLENFEQATDLSVLDDIESLETESLETESLDATDEDFAQLLAATEPEDALAALEEAVSIETTEVISEDSSENSLENTDENKPESIHADRYLDDLDILENTWLDELQDSNSNALSPLDEN